jgi:hypothetical protein
MVRRSSEPSSRLIGRLSLSRPPGYYTIAVRRYAEI